MINTSIRVGLPGKMFGGISDGPTPPAPCPFSAEVEPVEYVIWEFRHSSIKNESLKKLAEEAVMAHKKFKAVSSKIAVILNDAEPDIRNKFTPEEKTKLQRRVKELARLDKEKFENFKLAFLKWNGAGGWLDNNYRDIPEKLDKMYYNQEKLCWEIEK